MSSLRVSFAVLLIVVVVSSLGAAQQYTVTDLGTLGGNTSIGFAINDLGQVVGLAADKTGKQQAFFWSAQTGMIALGFLHTSDPISIAYGINNDGQVVGYSAGAFLWTLSGGMQDLGSLGGGGSFAYGINNLGQVVGGSLVSDSFTGHAFLWTANGGMQDLGTLGGTYSQANAINDAGEVVGYAAVSSTEVPAFLWTQTTGMQSLSTLGGGSSVATAISPSGQVVGYSATATNPQVPFTWSPSLGMQPLGTSGSGSTWATGINDFGQVVGNWAANSSHLVPPRAPSMHGVRWTQSRKIQTLNSLLVNTKILVVAAYAINSKGQIAGYGNNGHALLLTPTKQPSQRSKP